MGNVSAPQLLASSTPVELTFTHRGAVNVQIVFYTDAAGTLPVDAGLGTATLTTTRQTVGYEGDSVSPTLANVPMPVSDFVGGVKSLVPGGTLSGFGLGGGANRIFLTATVVVGGGGATHYRLMADAGEKP